MALAGTLSWLVYISESSEEGAPELTAVIPGSLQRAAFTRDGRS